MKKVGIIHPFLLSLYIVLFLYMRNVAEIPFVRIIIPGLSVLVLAAAVYFILNRVLKNGEKAGLITTLGLAFFFSYGHLFYNFIIGAKLFGFIFGRHRYFLPLWCCMFAAGVFFILKAKRNLNLITEYLNKIMVVLIVLSIISGGLNTYKFFRTSKLSRKEWNAKAALISHKQPVPLPDIYWVLLDGYTGEDTLKNIYHYDNSGFTDYLRSRGFYIPPKAVSNYPCTYPTLSSEFNMEHITFLTDKLGADSQDKGIPYKMIEDNKVVKFLKSLGYYYVHFDSQLGMDKKNRHADLWIGTGRFNPFEMLILKTSMVAPFLKYFDAENRRYRVLKSFEKLASIPDIKKPTYTYLHILPPHHPFIFGRNGEKLQPAQLFEVQFNEEKAWKNRKGYLNQLIFISKQAKKAIDTILAKSKTPPIIIVQADHGSASIGGFADPTDAAVRERMNILNAYYFPDGGNKVLYKDITPVNSFRMMFKYYFGVKLDRLPDKSYFSNYPVTPFKFTDVTDIVRYR